MSDGNAKQTTPNRPSGPSGASKPGEIHGGLEKAAGADIAPEVAEVQERKDAEDEKGYIGEVPDPTPNHAYTLAGVTAGEPTPETDEGAFRAAAERRVEVTKIVETDRAAKKG